MTKLLLALLVGAALCQDPHANQPPNCNNFHKTAESDRCKCWRAESCDRHESEDPHCKKYCKKEDCHCIGPCDT